jgi:outer membrane protein assembly factor BamA
MVHENPIIVDVLIFGNRNHQDVNAYSFFQDMIGRPQNSKVFNAKIRALEAAYSEKGYLLAKVKKALWDKDIGVFKIYIDEGYLSEIQYEGNFKTKKHFLDRKLAHTSSKHAYNEKEFYKDYQSLNKTGYFKKIEREIIPNEDGHGYVLKLNLEEKRSIKVGVGGGVNSGTGLFGNSTLKVSNIRGEGQDFQLSGTFGSGIGANSAFNDSQFFRQATLTTIGATYNIPYVFGSDKNLGLYANYTQGANFQVDFSEQLSLATGISVSRVFGEDDNHFLKNSFGLNYIDLDEVNRFEERRYVRDIARNYTEFFDVGQNYVPGVGDPAVSPFALRAARELREDQLIQGQFINFKSAYSFTKLDDLQNPHEGWKSQLSLEPVLGFSEVDSFTKFSGSVSRYVGLPKNSSFLVNGRWGYDVLGSIPQFAQYRLGGNSGVRGYRQFSQLGLGTTQAISTVELRTPIYNVIPQLKRNKYLKNLDLAAFTDIGVVGGSTDFNRLTDRLSQAWSAGVGVRVAVPFFGRIRVDLGFPIIDALYNKDFFRINFGPADNF